MCSKRPILFLAILADFSDFGPLRDSKSVLFRLGLAPAPGGAPGAHFGDMFEPFLSKSVVRSSFLLGKS